MLATAEEKIGQPLGTSPWVFIDQVQVNVFAEVTRWRTPGHCDPEHAKTTPYGGTLLHGFHAIALLSHFYKSSQLWPEDGRNPLNYGLDKVSECAHTCSWDTEQCYIVYPKKRFVRHGF